MSKSEFLIDHHLTLHEYNAMRTAVEWEEIEPCQAQHGLEGSDYIVVFRDNDGAPAAMARTLADGGYFVFMVDVIVLPKYQGKGLGSTLVNNVFDHYRESLKSGQKISLNLMAVKDKDGFYEKCGFTRRPNESVGSGMTIYLYPKGTN